MANKEFFEKYPLYRIFRYEPKKHWDRIEVEQIPRPAINMYCFKCDSIQTYNATDYSKYEEKHGIHKNGIYRVQYLCEGCHSFVREFFLEFTETFESNEDGRDYAYCLSVKKVGQFPAWDITMDRELEMLLGEHAEYYKKGLTCESQGYGIGAFAYFRRITEEVIDKLLDSVENLLQGDDKIKYHTALAEVKKTTVTQQKIDLVKDLLPSVLRPGGVNPLSVLHSALSEGLHAESDEQCLEYADAIRKSLVFLVNRLVRTEQENQIFSENMKKILDKKKENE